MSEVIDDDAIRDLIDLIDRLAESLTARVLAKLEATSPQQAAEPGPAGLSYRDVKREYDISRTTTSEAVRKGELHPARVGRKCVFLRSDVEAWLRSKQRLPTRRRAASK